MGFVPNFLWEKGNFTALFLLAVIALFSNHVALVTSEGPATEVYYDCEKYCSMDCLTIPKEDHFHREKCKDVHSHQSNCSCHFGGIAFGVFFTIGLVAILFAMCCAWRFCGRPKNVTNTKIFVVAHPVTDEDLENNNFNENDPHSGVYSIPMEKGNPSQRFTFSSPLTDRKHDTTTWTVITRNNNNNSRHGSPINPASPPSQRVFFGEPSATDQNNSDVLEERIFSSPSL